MMFKIDMDKEGLHMFFREYEVKALRYLLKHRSCYSIDMVTNFKEDASRASFIQFLNRLSGEPFKMVIIDIETSKGGYRNKYVLRDDFMTQRSIFQCLKMMIDKKLSAGMITMYGEE